MWHPWSPRNLGGLGAAVCLLVAASCLAEPADSAGAHPALARDGSYDAKSTIAHDAWEDRDDRPGGQPSDQDPTVLAYYLRECVSEAVSHMFDIPDKLLSVARIFGVGARREAMNVNAVDEVPNSSWFTNRNVMRAIPTSTLLQGSDSVFAPALPWTVTGVKKGGAGKGFTIKDSTGKKWAVELDPPGCPQLCSGADMVARTLLHAAGYNVPHNAPIRFQRSELSVDPKLLTAPAGTGLDEAGLDSVLAWGAVFPDGRYAAKASLWLSGHVLGSPHSRGRRAGDPNDWYHHENRRELRGLYVFSSWIGHWDTKDPNLLDTFSTRDGSPGHVEHYLLDCDEALGAQATGPKTLWEGYEQGVDWGWIGRRLLTLGFVVEPWRKAHQETGMPSVGNFSSDHFQPAAFAEYQNPAMREMTDRDAYWGAKLVASFSDAQVAASVDAAHYDDPRARDYLVKTLIERRNKVLRHWFTVVAPLDFFNVQGGALEFHDLAVDLGMEAGRGYDVEVEAEGGVGRGHREVHLNLTQFALNEVDAGTQRLSLEFAVAGSNSKPARVELERRDAQWIITRVRHG